MSRPIVSSFTTKDDVRRNPTSHERSQMNNIKVGVVVASGTDIFRSHVFEVKYRMVTGAGLVLPSTSVHGPGCNFFQPKPFLAKCNFFHAVPKSLFCHKERMSKSLARDIKDLVKSYAMGGASGAITYGAMKTASRYMKRKRYRKTRRSRKRQRSYKRSRRTTTMKDVFRELKTVKRKASVGLGELTHREVIVGELQSGVSTAVYDVVGVNTGTQLKATMALARYYDASSNTIAVVNRTPLTATSPFYFKSTVIKVLVRSNYQVPVNLTMYYWKAKADTGLTSETCRTNGLADVGNPTASSISVYPTDSAQLVDMYKSYKTVSCTLDAGKQKTMSVTLPSFNFDPSLDDSHSDTYQSQHYAGQIMFRINGAMCHESNGANQYGRVNTGIDYEVEIIHKCEYEAGARLKTVSITDGRNTSFTSGAGFITNKPVADNQTHSTL